MQNSSFTTSLFRVTFTPDNSSLSFDINGYSLQSAKVVIGITVYGYGYKVVDQKRIDPCGSDSKDLKGLCPMPAAAIQILGNAAITSDELKKIPSGSYYHKSGVHELTTVDAIYYIPDLDGKVIVWINSTETGQPLACVSAELGNAKTVHQKGVALGIAVVVLLGLILSAIASGGGHSTTAAHLAANALALFGYFQAQALIGMTAVTMPPIVRSWTQNFQWSMGIIRVGFLQKMATWYLRSTGGKQSTYLSNLATTSVQVQKRSLYRRTNSQMAIAESLKHLTVKGIERVGFVSKIEITNIFFTSYMFFCIFIVCTIVAVVLFKVILELLHKAKWIKPERFQDFRVGWKVMLKGILFRIVLITFPQIIVLGFWELTRRDSPAETALAVCTIVTVLALLFWGSYNVWHRARRSIALHGNPAYILFSDSAILNKWGFLYVQFKATMYFFIIINLLHILMKALFIAFGQKNGTVQAVGLLVLELIMLVTICVMRPYMDKKTNGVNISIAVVNFINVILLLFFSNIFGVPSLAIGIMGVLFFILNTVFALVLLIMVLWASISAILSKNPDTRYQTMRDDRGSFIKSTSKHNLHDELDALGAAARGDGQQSQMSLARGGEGKLHKPMTQLDDESGGSGRPLLDNELGHIQGGFPPMRSHDSLMPRRNESPLRTGSPAQRGEGPWKRGVGY
ncbi:hypothetical protein BLS_001738 [Venturia inaequalis]|uniref:ML-like domain-containing protein n=1 Tax=Venturia inaequalis TaxID=5025 RepID=A0A8H3UWJ7_VENIN|nr:hypothetical protein BLS_001738 [Venturia inaequalis]